MRSAVAAPGDTRDNHRGDNGTAQGRQCVILSVRDFMRFQKKLATIKVVGFAFLLHFLLKPRLVQLTIWLHCLPLEDWTSSVSRLKPGQHCVPWWPWWWWWWGHPGGTRGLWPQCQGQEPESTQSLPQDPQALQDAETKEHDRKVCTFLYIHVFNIGLWRSLKVVLW